MKELAVRALVPDHELLRLIGRGSYGEVWLARNIMGTLRAVKIVHRTAFDDARPYEREFAGLQKFEPISRTHPSQLDILHIGRNETGGYFYYVMELADDAGRENPEQAIEAVGPGGSEAPEDYRPKTLRSEMERRGPLAPAECIELGLALSTALAHLHRHGLVHRDIKPSNIIYVHDQVKLADIGLVSAADATLSFVGTIGYAPHEGPGTPKADIYSLGKVLYEAATGRDRQQFPELPTQLSGTADQQQQFLELNEVLLKSCDENPSRRYQTADAMHEDLLALRSGESLVRLRAVERRFELARRIGAVALLLVVLILPAYLYEARQTRRVRKLASDNLGLVQEARTRAAEAKRNELTARENLYAADISLAFHALESDNLRQALDLLRKQIPKPGEPDLRGFEWRYLWQQCQSEELFSLPSHGAVVQSIEFSSDGQTLLTASEDKTVKICDIASRRLLVTLTNTESVICATFSPRDKIFAMATLNSVSLVDTTSLRTLRALPGARYTAKFTPDGKFLVTGATNGLILWETESWTPEKTHEIKRSRELHEPEEIALELQVTCSPDSHHLAATADDGILILSVPDFREVATLADQLPRMRPLSFAPVGRMIAAGASGNSVKLWDIESGKPLKLLTGHSDSAFGLTFSPDGKQLATASGDQTVKLWDTPTGQLIRTFRGHAEEVWRVAFSPDGKLLASASKDGAVKVWDPLQSPKTKRDLSNIMPLGFDPAGNLWGLTLTNDGCVILLDASLRSLSSSAFWGRTEGFFSFHPMGLNTVSGDGRTAMLDVEKLSTDSSAANRHGPPCLEFWDLSRGEFLWSIDSSQYSGSTAFFAPKGRLVYVPGRESSVSVWDLDSRSQRCVLTNVGTTICVSDDGRLAMTFTSPDVVKLWTINKNKTPHCVTLNTPPEFMALSPDDSLLATSTENSIIQLLSVPSGRVVSTLVGTKRANIGLGFSGDNLTLASGSDDGALRLWQVATGRELLKLLLPAEEIETVRPRFSADGRTLVALIYSTKQECTTRVWFAPSFAEIAVAEGRDYRAEMGQEPATLLAVGRMLVSRDRKPEALEVFTKLIQLCGDHRDLECLRAVALKDRSQLYLGLGGREEAGADNCAALSIPPRDPSLPSALLDLSAYFNRSLEGYPDVIPVFSAFSSLPRGRQRLPGCPGVEFDIRGIIRLDRKDEWSRFTHAVEGIDVQQKCRRLHFLESTNLKETEGTEVATYLVRYSDGTTEEIPVCYGQNLRNWDVPLDPNETSEARVAWTGTDPRGNPIRLFIQTWVNPRPGAEIRALDFIPTQTPCAPLVLAITAE